MSTNRFPIADMHISKMAATSRTTGAEWADEAKGLFRRLWREIREDDIPGEAAKVAYYAFLSFPPTLLVLFGLTGFFGGADVATEITGRLEAMLPDAASSLIQRFVQQVVMENSPGPFTIGLVLALWAASSVFASLTKTLNQVYEAVEDRSWIRIRAVALAVMMAATLLLLCGSVALLAGPALARALDLFGTASVIWAIVQWPLAFLLVVAAFALVYGALPAPGLAGARSRPIFRGALGAAALWVLATAGFRIYIANFSSYNETYGFLGAVIVLLLWLYLSGIVVLLGGELNSVLRRRSPA